jgi:hypothetical protein
MLKYINFFSFLFLFYWLLLWGSINTRAFEIFNFGNSLIESVNSLRLILPLLFSILSSIYFFYILITKKIKISKIHLYFFIIFISQLIGLYLNDERDFNIDNTYLIILAFGVIFLFILCDYHELNNLYKYFFAITLISLLAAFNLSIWQKMHEINNLNFYEAFNERSVNILKQANIRITGLSRMLAIINLFIILYLFSLKNFYVKIIFKLFIIFSTSLLLFMQSRGTLICYFTSLTFIIFFFLDKKIKNKIKNILLFIIIPIFLYFLVNGYLLKNIKNKEETKTYNRILTIDTSGRSTIWHYTLQNHEYSKIFGYGPNGDRFFLRDFDKKKYFGDNASNIFIYSLVSGGVISLIFLILIFFEIYLTLKKIIQDKTKNFIKHSIILNLSIACLIFFSLRSIFENSFGLFSVDFLITYLSLSYIIFFRKVEKI